MCIEGINIVMGSLICGVASSVVVVFFVLFFFCGERQLDCYETKTRSNFD